MKLDVCLQRKWVVNLQWSTLRISILLRGKGYHASLLLRVGAGLLQSSMEANYILVECWEGTAWSQEKQGYPPTMSVHVVPEQGKRPGRPGHTTAPAQPWPHAIQGGLPKQWSWPVPWCLSQSDARHRNVPECGSREPQVWQVQRQAERRRNDDMPVSESPSNATEEALVCMCAAHHSSLFVGQKPFNKIRYTLCTTMEKLPRHTVKKKKASPR